MWRGYGNQDTGVAIVFNNKLGAENLSPRKVTYANIEDFFDILKKNFNCFTDAIKNAGFKFQKIKNDDNAKQTFINYIAILLANEVFYIKHPAFHEEHECRLAVIDPVPEKYGFCIEQDVKIVSGVPQKIYKYLLCQNGNIDKHCSRQLENILENIIIGPCDHPELVAEAIKLKANSCNVHLNEDSFAFCDIPLRKN